MKSLAVKVFDSNNIEIYPDGDSRRLFLNFNKEKMVNASLLAFEFPEKNINDFIKDKQVIAFMERLGEETGRPVLVKEYWGFEYSIWMHRALAFKFAAWLTLDFELWLYDVAENMLLAETDYPDTEPSEEGNNNQIDD
ncbi:KilA-N domain-containing protein [Pontibacter chinhatensis]|uniref:KilA-N domain-containing protein n=1 Tax=Pontibacter chinhatensis TaxID=1436961 RepID=A0A1I2VGW0_9BACT|nr:KilA-N domain-containing protein [Pontibacter chinhatensis]SFG87447.1 KilA-N domain-containing protein [Pontibacter chinhatensis]